MKSFVFFFVLLPSLAISQDAYSSCEKHCTITLTSTVTDTLTVAGHHRGSITETKTVTDTITVPGPKHGHKHSKVAVTSTETETSTITESSTLTVTVTPSSSTSIYATSSASSSKLRPFPGSSPYYPAGNASYPMHNSTGYIVGTGSSGLGTGRIVGTGSTDLLPYAGTTPTPVTNFGRTKSSSSTYHAPTASPSSYSSSPSSSSSSSSSSNYARAAHLSRHAIQPSAQVAKPTTTATGLSVPYPVTPNGQSIPSTAKAPGTFSAAAVQLKVEPPDTFTPPPAIYNAMDVDIPFMRLYNGSVKFFPHTNDVSTDLNMWGSEYDNANQSACGIPYNAFQISTVAIHPYFLKYAGLDRYCQQDVCISFWTADGKSDMMLKVTDICSTDPSDPSYCSNPAEIKIAREKAKIINHLDYTPTGDSWPAPMWWFFMKCWDDGLAQPSYDDNWFTLPHLPNNLKWAQDNAVQQQKNNQEPYVANGWQQYPNGGYNLNYDSGISPPIDDWKEGDPTPAWEPIAGGAVYPNYG